MLAAFTDTVLKLKKMLKTAVYCILHHHNDVGES